MHWGFRYLGKHAAQKVLGAIPYGFGVQELVKRATGRAERFTGAGYLRRRLRGPVLQRLGDAVRGRPGPDGVGAGGRRFLKASGRFLHVVDCCDLHAQHDRRIPRLAYRRGASRSGTC